MSTRELAERTCALAVEISDHLEAETDGPTVLTGLGAAVVVQLDRFGGTIEQFTESLVRLKAGREAELSRQAMEN